ncbi:MAG: Crp/Fnr family transcriptional regulator [Spirochaetales bacterium]|nr:Crp/Fnr family transcriptional regulator [Spirochaetales bacterium]
MESCGKGVSQVSKLNSNFYLLQASPIFRELARENIDYLCNHVIERQYNKGDIVCRKGSLACSVFLIKTGTVSEIALDGNEFSTIAVIKNRFDYFGELGVLLEESYTTTAIVTSPAVILAIPGGVFRKVVWGNPAALKEILKMFKRGLQNSAQKFISCTMFNVEGRLAYLLLMMHQGQNDGSSIRIIQENLSRHCGISRQTVSCLLNGWKKQAVIDIQRGRISVLAVDKLTDILMNNAKSY